MSLELLHRGIRSSLCPIQGDLTLVGSSTDCDVRVVDPSVSNYHASLMNTPEGVWVIDLLGLGGVTVNGDAVRFARVEDGDAARLAFPGPFALWIGVGRGRRGAGRRDRRGRGVRAEVPGSHLLPVAASRPRRYRRRW